MMYSSFYENGPDQPFLSVVFSTHMRREEGKSWKSWKLSATLITEALIIEKFAFSPERKNSNVTFWIQLSARE